MPTPSSRSALTPTIALLATLAAACSDQPVAPLSGDTSMSAADRSPKRVSCDADNGGITCLLDSVQSSSLT
jgi:hypothetical protein